MGAASIPERAVDHSTSVAETWRINLEVKYHDYPFLRTK